MNYSFIVNHEHKFLSNQKEISTALSIPEVVCFVMENLDLSFKPESRLKSLGSALYIRENLSDREDRFLIDSIKSILLDSNKITDPKETRNIEDCFEEKITDSISKAILETKLDNKLFSIRDFPLMPRWIRGWIRKGFRQAKDKYVYHPPLQNCYFEMQSQLSKKLSEAKEGEEILISIVRSQAKFKVR